MKHKLNIILSLIVGLGIFGFFLYHVGVGSVFSIFLNIRPIYLGLYFVFTTLTFFPTAWRWGIILKAYGKRVPLRFLMKYTIAGYSISYLTPSAKVGGEPLRAYMLSKERGVDIKLASSSVIIEKFVELAGSAIFGVVGLVLFFSLPGVSLWLKLILGIALTIAFLLLIIVYHRSVTGKGSFSSLFLTFRLDRIAKWKSFVKVIRDVETHMKDFFVKQKKAFMLSFFTYLIYAVLVVFEYKFLLLGLGFNESIRTVILALIVAGFAGFIPVPASLGFLEAGQSTLFSAIKGAGSIGFALSLLVRLRALIFVALGFSFITYFSGKYAGNKIPFVGKKKKCSVKKGKG
ncbi:MAG: flippase-like domain-containing protein [Nanoarchaeota archaeon]|nr:flippase-like domain-containing protein [Nanoarchaeota archaeon]